jgi:hypothetical protein
MAGSRSDDQLITADFSYRPPSGVYNAKPPKVIGNQIHFIRNLYLLTVQSSTTAIVESNYSFTASPYMSGFANYLAVFDQYFLHSVVCTVTSDYTAANNNTDPLQIVTAIDFDNVSALGSVANLLGFNTAVQSILLPGKSVTRVIMPCNSTNLQGGAGAGVTRTWVDAALPSVPFFGFRSIISASGTTAAVSYAFSLTWALRNNF